MKIVISAYCYWLTKKQKNKWITEYKHLAEYDTMYKVIF